MCTLNCLTIYYIYSTIILNFYYVLADYQAAVVEYQAVNYTCADQTIQENLKNFLEYIKEASKNEADIIVFPEYGLTGLVIYPQNYAIDIPPIGSLHFDNQILQEISRAAKMYKIYVVFNLLELEKSENKTLYYNTNLVLDKNGTLVAKYRKIGLFFEPELTKGNDIVTFKTEFGNFGLITCMDILYYRPSQQMFSKDPGITDVIQPAAWNSVLPFYMSIEAQIGYAKANKVNLLASNYQIPSVARGGSGIYSKNGNILNMHLSGLNNDPKLILAKIRSQNDSSENYINIKNMSNYNTYRDFNYSAYAYKDLQLHEVKGSIVDTLCYNNFCCNYNISVRKQDVVPTEIYKLAAYDGVTLFETTPVNMKFCSVIACSTNDTSTCGLQQTFKTKFQKINISGVFKNGSETFYRPITLKGDLLPFLNINFEQIQKEEGVSVHIETFEESNESNLVIFGIYGRESE